MKVNRVFTSLNQWNDEAKRRILHQRNHGDTWLLAGVHRLAHLSYLRRRNVRFRPEKMATFLFNFPQCQVWLLESRTLHCFKPKKRCKTNTKITAFHLFTLLDNNKYVLCHLKSFIIFNVKSYFSLLILNCVPENPVPDKSELERVIKRCQTSIRTSLFTRVGCYRSIWQNTWVSWRAKGPLVPGLKKLATGHLAPFLNFTLIPLCF